MNNDNVAQIGVALKWRNTFDLTKRYYQENVVTACGCVFRCKVLQAQGKSPIKMTDDQGHIVYTNTDVWDVLVDMAYYYNYAVDTKKLTQQMLDYAKELDKAIQKQQKEIEVIQKDNKDQWTHINAIEKINDEQQRELNAIFDTISCFSEGIWIDTLLWSNETIWDNNKYAITDDLQRQINELTEQHNTDIERIDTHIADHERKQTEYEKTTDDKLLVLALGAKTTLTVSPSVIHKNTDTRVTLKASVNIDDVINGLLIYQGQTVLASLPEASEEHSITHSLMVNASDNIKYRAESLYKGLSLPVNVMLYARHPVYCGFGSNINEIKTDSHKLSPRTSATGTYKAINTKNSQRYYILVPSDIGALSDFTMGGAPYVMNNYKETLDEVEYTVYVSGARYNNGAEVNITAK